MLIYDNKEILHLKLNHINYHVERHSKRLHLITIREDNLSNEQLKVLELWNFKKNNGIYEKVVNLKR